eukprot:844051-Prymnesium_polylepis.2
MEELRTMNHPHIERTMVAAGMISPKGMITPEHPDIMFMIKSKDAMRYAIGCVLGALYASDVLAGVNVYMHWDRDSIPDGIPEELPNPSLTCQENGHRMQPLVARLYEDYFRRLE